VAGLRDDLRGLAQLALRDAALLRGARERVLGVTVLQRLEEALEVRLDAGTEVLQGLLPIRVLLEEPAVGAPGLQQLARDGEHDRALRAGPRRQPEVGLRRGVGQPRVHHDEPRAVRHALDDALRVRVEIVAGLQVRAQQQDGLRVGEVGAGAVGAHHEREADARARAADVGVAVVPVDAPRLQDALHGAVVAGAAAVVHDLGAAVLLERLPDACGEGVERLVPRDALPFAAAARALALQGVQDAVGVLDLVERRRALRADAAAASRVHGIALEAADLPRLLVDVREQAARRLAVEADGRDEAHFALHAARPRLRVELDEVVPLLGRRRARERCGEEREGIEHA